MLLENTYSFRYRLSKPQMAKIHLDDHACTKKPGLLYVMFFQLRQERRMLQTIQSRVLWE